MMSSNAHHPVAHPPHFFSLIASTPVRDSSPVRTHPHGRPLSKRNRFRPRTLVLEAGTTARATDPARDQDRPHPQEDPRDCLLRSRLAIAELSCDAERRLLERAVGEYARPVPPKVNAHSMSNIHGLLNDFSTHPAGPEGAPLRGGRTGAPADEITAPESAIGRRGRAGGVPRSRAGTTQRPWRPPAGTLIWNPPRGGRKGPH